MNAGTIIAWSLAGIILGVVGLSGLALLVAKGRSG